MHIFSAFLLGMWVHTQHLPLDHVLSRGRLVHATEPAPTQVGRVATVSWRESSQPETVVPDVSLTRSRDGSTGTATFRFQDPEVLSWNDIWENGLITGLWLKDEEGVLVTRDLDVSFERGRPHLMTAILVLKSNAEWERFMRFMRRYADANSLSFESAEGES